MGPMYGYYPEPKKTVLIVDKEYDSKAHVSGSGRNDMFPPRSQNSVFS